MALVLHLCAGAEGFPRRVELSSFAEFADGLHDLETVTDKLAALTVLPADLVAEPALNRHGLPTKTVGNIAAVTLLGLDFDGVTEAEMLGVLSNDLAGLRWAAHTTFSHPEEVRATGRQRWRVWVELAAPVPASQWQRAREIIDGQLSVKVDPVTRNPNRLMFAPCARPGEESQFEVFDWRDFPNADQATPLEVPSDLPSPSVAIPSNGEGESEEPSNLVDLNDLKKLRDKLRRRTSAFENTIGDYLAKIIRGEPFVESNSHEPTLDLARTLSDELPEASAESLARFVERSFGLMRQLHGSDETEAGFVEKIKSWRRKRRAEKAKYALPKALVGESSAPEAFENILDSRFVVFNHPDGTQVTYDISADGVCVRQNGDQAMVQTIMHALPCDDEGKPMTSRKARNRIDDWRSFARTIQTEPEPSRFKSDDGPCFQRLPFDLAPGTTPAWDEFTTRLSNAELFKAFVWTGFEKRNRGRQVLWVKGEGEDGKSTVMSVIREALGAAATAANAKTFDSRFGMTTLDGKRFAIVFDCKDTRLLMNEALRNVTSGDEVIVEYKGQPLETKRLGVKLVVCSNFLPDVTSSRADTSRLILLSVDKAANRDDPKWEGRLRAELPAFLAACKEAYDRLCPHHGKLPLGDEDRAAVAERADAYEEEFSDTADEFFQITGDKADEAPCGPIFKALTGRGMTSRGWPAGKYEAFKAYLARRGVASRRVTAGRVFVGARLKSRGEVKPFEGRKVA